MKKIHYTWLDAKNQTQDILRQLHNSAWQPDYVVGITRGGAVPAVMISQYLQVPMMPLMVSLRDGGECVSDLGMAQDAHSRKNILIVDDINDSGATINWIMKDWPSGCFPSDPSWQDIWGNNVKFATLIDNAASDATVDYRAVEIDKAKDPCWIVFPWEDWWAR